MISSHVDTGTSFAATFSIIVSIGGKSGIALVDSGSTYTFMNFASASKINCNIVSTSLKKVMVEGRGHLDTSTTANSITYFIQHRAFTNDFKLLQLRGYDITLGCD
jgi:predicted aspartyl protease